MVCPNYKKENKNTNIKCEFCNSELITLDDRANPKKEEITLQQKLCMLCFFCNFWNYDCIWIIFFIFSSVYSFILENKTKNEYNWYFSQRLVDMAELMIIKM